MSRRIAARLRMLLAHRTAIFAPLASAGARFFGWLRDTSANYDFEIRRLSNTEAVAGAAGGGANADANSPFGQAYCGGVTIPDTTAVSIADLFGHPVKLGDHGRG